MSSQTYNAPPSSSNFPGNLGGHSQLFWSFSSFFIPVIQKSNTFLTSLLDTEIIENKIPIHEASRIMDVTRNLKVIGGEEVGGKCNSKQEQLHITVTFLLDQFVRKSLLLEA